MSLWNKTESTVNLPKYLNTNYPGNTDVYMINADRIADSTTIGESVAHQGWVKVYPGQGSITSISISGNDPNKTYTPETLTITGANTATASATLNVTGTVPSQTLKVIVNNGGAGYTSNTTVSATTGDNKDLTFTVSGNGRFGRNLTETLVALSDPTITKNYAKAYFKD